MKKPKTKVRKIKSVQIGDVTYHIEYSDDPRTVSPGNDDGRPLFGVQASSEGMIGLLLDKTPGRMGHTFYHELTHGIVEAFGIDTMVNLEGKHVEENIDRMAMGLYIALRSMGIYIEDFLEEPSGKASRRQSLR